MDINKNVEKTILEAARKVFLEKGYDGTNMTMIAKAAGIGRPALYYYFRTKDLIFKAVVDSLLLDFIPKILKIMKSNMSMEEKIDHCIDEYMANLLRNPKLPVFILKEMDRGIEGLKEAASSVELKSYFVQFVSLYENEVNKGTVKRVPYIFFMLSFIGPMVTPFLSRNAIEAAMMDPDIRPCIPDDSFEGLMEDWKSYVSKNIKNLLLVKKD